MRVFRHFTDLPDDARGAVVTLGNFDGVHLGHQAVVNRAAEIARAEGRKLSVLTFEPHTRAFFRPEEPPFRLTPFRAKLRALEALGVEQVIVLAFDGHVSRMTADDFARHVLKDEMQVAYAVAGENFRYGHRHAGTMATLAEAGRLYGFGVTAVGSAKSADGMIYSATAIRNLLADGNIGRASELLGRPWEIDGRVIHGDRRGRELGFPTANLLLGEHMHPTFGVYAVRARVDEPGAAWLDGVASLGIRPMWRVEQPLLEVHLLDYSGDLYGRILRVRLIERLRREENFATIQELIDQVERDKAAAREALLASP